MIEFKIEPLLETLRFLDISDEEYFGSGYTNYISNSRLKLINPAEGGSVEKWTEGFGQHGIYSDSLYFGSAIHEMTLQKDEFNVVLCDRPTAKLGFVIDEVLKARQTMPIYKAIEYASDRVGYYKGKLTPQIIKNIFTKGLSYYLFRKHYVDVPGKTPIFLNGKDYAKFKEVMASIERNKQIQKLLNPPYIETPPLIVNEGTLVMDVKVTVNGKPIILHLKAKLDNFTIDFENEELALNDLKTTGHYLSKFMESFEKYHYARQMGMYAWLLKLYAEKYHNLKYKKYTVNMLLASTVPDYRSGVFRVKNADINRGFKEFIKLLKMVAYYELFGHAQPDV